MSEGYGPSSCPSRFVPKSKLLHNLEVQYSLVPKLSHHGGKNNRPGGLKNMVSSSRDDRSKDGMITVRSWFLSEAMFLPSF